MMRWYLSQCIITQLFRLWFFSHSKVFLLLKFFLRISSFKILNIWRCSWVWQLFDFCLQGGLTTAQPVPRDKVCPSWPGTFLLWVFWSSWRPSQTLITDILHRQEFSKIIMLFSWGSGPTDVQMELKGPWSKREKMKARIISVFDTFTKYVQYRAGNHVELRLLD